MLELQRDLCMFHAKAVTESHLVPYTTAEDERAHPPFYPRRCDEGELTQSPVKPPQIKELRSLADVARNAKSSPHSSPRSSPWCGSGPSCQPGTHEALEAPLTPLGSKCDSPMNLLDGWVEAIDARPQPQALADDSKEAERRDTMPQSRDTMPHKESIAKVEPRPKISAKSSKSARYFDTLTRSVSPLPYSRVSQMSGSEFCQNEARRLLRRTEFDYIMGAIIFANTLTIGMEITLSVEGKVSESLQALEHIFLIIYIIELALRVVGNGREVFNNNFVLFDTALVVVGVLCTWIIDPLARVMAASGDKDNDTVLDNLMILRVARLLRLVRTLRLVVQFKTLWRLANGLLQSLDVLMSTTALLMLSLYVFACAGVEFITLDDNLRHGGEVGSIIDEHFSSLPTIMLTLFRFATLDSIAGIYTPIIKQKPMLTSYFFSIALIVSIALMNLVTAVLVESTIQRASKDTEMERVMLKKKLNTLTPLIREHFALLDWDNDGYLDRDEIMEDVAVPVELMKILNPDTDAMMTLFDILDTDDSGKVDEEEFVEGVLHMAMTDVPVETQQIMKLMRLQRRKLDGLTDKIFEMLGAISQFEAHCTGVGSQEISRTRGTKPRVSMNNGMWLYF